MRKLNESSWLGAIFSKAGLSRLGILPETAIDLYWMVPAPAQGVIAVVCRSDQQHVIDKLAKINHKPTAITSDIERAFMNVLEGGCSAPIGAHASIDGEYLNFHGTLHNENGTQKVEVKRRVLLIEINNLGREAALAIKADGGELILKEIKNK